MTRRRSITFFSAGLLAVSAALMAAAGSAFAVAVSSTEPSFVEVTPTPTDSFQGETATPVVTLDPCFTFIVTKVDEVALEDSAPSVAPTTPCMTPVESFQGETSRPNDTPPPTGTSGDPTHGATPTFALLLASLFGALGLAAAKSQRRSATRR